MVLLRWGLIPFFAKGVAPGYSTINARIETVRTAASYRGPWKRGQRCAVIANGFYEWQVQADGKSKQPFYIHLNDQPEFAMAGLWESSRGADGVGVESCTHITLPANALLARIHNAKLRMPAILAREDRDTWLHGTAEEAWSVLKPYSAELMVAWPVSSRVNKPANNEASLLEPIDIPH